MNEDLRNWFSKSHPEGNWKRYNTKGEAIGPCAREPGEPKPKCLSNEKAAKMSKSQIASAVKRKRKEDPTADRKGKGGKPIMVSNRIKEENSNEEERYCPLCDKRETRSECAYGEKAWDKVSVKDEEYSMARSELETISKAVKRLKTKVSKGEGDLEAWVQSKITKAADYIDTAADYLESGESEIEEAKDPCWKGYKQVGMKKKGDKMVPNCVKESELSLVEKILLEMEAEVLNEKNVPTNPSLWSKMKAKAKAKFDVYPSAYANGWAAKEYKKAGGGWKSVNEDVTIEDLNGNTFAEVIDVIKVEPLVSEECCSKCDKDPCECRTKKYHGGSAAKPGPNKNYVKPMGDLEESTRMPAKTGNIVFVNLTWRGRYYGIKMFFPYTKLPTRKEIQLELNKVYPECRVYSFQVSDYTPGEPIVQVTEDWQSVNKKDKTDGMSQKAVDAYRSENPGSKLKTAVTEKDPGPGRSKRRKSFCARSKGQQDMHNIDCSKTPDKAICKARRRWRC